LVVEGGASVFSPEGADGFDETVALLELQGDEPTDFSERVLRRIVTAQQSGQCFDAVVLFTGSSCSPDAQAARRLIALAVAAHAPFSPHLSELLIVASPAAPQQQRDQILELADELLSTDLEPLPVRVCFSSPQPEPRMRSGVFARPVNQE
jgi:hypothetical protein